MSRRLLVLGSAGFAGRHLVDTAEAAGFEVVRGTRRRGPDSDVVCDLLDGRSVMRALGRTSPDAIANLAGSASVAQSFDEPAAAFEVNALGSLNLLEAASKQALGAYLLMVSSGEVYGARRRRELPLREGYAMRPYSPYAASKAAMETLCHQYQRVANLRIGIVRAFNHIGPGQSEAFAASSFARQIAAAERAGADEAELRTGNLSVERDISDVRDIARSYLLIIERELAGTFNACSGKAIPIARIINCLRDETGLPIRVEVEADRLRPGEAATVYGSPARLQAATGWRPRIPLRTTAADILDWWRRRMAA